MDRRNRQKECLKGPTELVMRYGATSLLLPSPLLLLPFFALRRPHRCLVILFVAAMNAKTILIALALLLACAAVQASVVDLTSENFASSIKEGKWLVKLYVVNWLLLSRARSRSPAHSRLLLATLRGAVTASASPPRGTSSLARSPVPRLPRSTARSTAPSARSRAFAATPPSSCTLPR